MRFVELETSAPYGRSSQGDLEAQLKQKKERHLEGLPVWQAFSEQGLIPSVSQSTMSQVRAPPPLEPAH